MVSEHFCNMSFEFPGTKRMELIKSVLDIYTVLYQKLVREMNLVAAFQALDYSSAKKHHIRKTIRPVYLI